MTFASIGARYKVPKKIGISQDTITVHMAFPRFKNTLRCEKWEDISYLQMESQTQNIRLIMKDRSVLRIPDIDAKLVEIIQEAYLVSRKRRRTRSDVKYNLTPGKAHRKKTDRSTGCLYRKSIVWHVPTKSKQWRFDSAFTIVITIILLICSIVFFLSDSIMWIMGFFSGFFAIVFVYVWIRYRSKWPDQMGIRRIGVSTEGVFFDKVGKRNKKLPDMIPMNDIKSVHSWGEYIQIKRHSVPAIIKLNFISTETRRWLMDCIEEIKKDQRDR